MNSSGEFLFYNFIVLDIHAKIQSFFYMFLLTLSTCWELCKFMYFLGKSKRSPICDPGVIRLQQDVSWILRFSREVSCWGLSYFAYCGFHQGLWFIAISFKLQGEAVAIFINRYSSQVGSAFPWGARSCFSFSSCFHLEGKFPAFDFVSCNSSIEKIIRISFHVQHFKNTWILFLIAQLMAQDGAYSKEGCRRRALSFAPPCCKENGCKIPIFPTTAGII